MPKVTVKNEPLMLEAFGPCLPTLKVQLLTSCLIFPTLVCNCVNCLNCATVCSLILTGRRVFHRHVQLTAELEKYLLSFNQ